jgi:hypothetical protein
MDSYIVLCFDKVVILQLFYYILWTTSIFVVNVSSVCKSKAIPVTGRGSL